MSDLLYFLTTDRVSTGKWGAGGGRRAGGEGGAGLAALSRRPLAPRAARTSSSGSEGLAVLTHRTDLAVAPRHTVSQRPRRPDHDLGPVLPRHGEQGLLAQPQRLLRLVGLQTAPGQPQRGQGTVQDLLGGVQPQGALQCPLRALVMGKRDQRVALVEQQLALGVAEGAVAAVGGGKLAQDP